MDGSFALKLFAMLRTESVACAGMHRSTSQRMSTLLDTAGLPGLRTVTRA